MFLQVTSFLQQFQGQKIHAPINVIHTNLSIYAGKQHTLSLNAVVGFFFNSLTVDEMFSNIAFVAELSVVK